MTSTTPTGATTVETAAGAVEYVEIGAGDPVLFVHGSPGGSDQAALMGGFLAAAGCRVVCPSRPGYLGTPLTDANGTPDAQADLLAALLDELGLDRVAVACWSGGGPATYRLAATRPERVSAIAALAAVSHDYEFEEKAEGLLLAGRVGAWMVKELNHHAPKTVVKMLASEEGDLTKEQVKALSTHIWEDEAKRAFALDLMASISGDRKAGLKNDQHRFPHLGDLGLASVAAPVLLVHGTADSDVPPEQSDHALAALPHAELLPVADGTHVATWTDPTSADVQARVAAHLRP